MTMATDLQLFLLRQFFRINDSFIGLAGIVEKVATVPFRNLRRPIGRLHWIIQGRQRPTEMFPGCQVVGTQHGKHPPVRLEPVILGPSRSVGVVLSPDSENEGVGKIAAPNWIAIVELHVDQPL